MILRCLCLLLPVVLAVAPSLCVAVVETVKVTPENLTHQPLAFRVEVSAVEPGCYHFKLLVSAGRNAISPVRLARLTIGDVYPRTGSDKRALLRVEPVFPKLQCDLLENHEGGALYYNIGLRQELVPEAWFEFQNIDPEDNPSGDIYRLPLSEFMLRQ